MYENSACSTVEMEPLILVPGLLCDARIFADQSAAFPTARTIDDGGDFDSLPEMASNVLAIAPSRFALVGHSMGARVALEIVRQAPDRVSRLALVSTGVHPRRDGEIEQRMALRDIGRKQGMAALVDAWLPPMVAPARRGDHALMDRLRAMCVDAGLHRYEAQIAALIDRPEVEDLLPAIHCPTLVAVGSEDQWSPPDQHRGIAAAIPGAELVVLHGAGHMLPAEAPEPFNVAIAQWLARPINITKPS